MTHEDEYIQRVGETLLPQLEEQLKIIKAERDRWRFRRTNNPSLVEHYEREVGIFEQLIALYEYTLVRYSS